MSSRLFQEIRDRISSLRLKYLAGQSTQEDFFWLSDVAYELSLEALLQSQERESAEQRMRILRNQLGLSEKDS